MCVCLCKFAAQVMLGNGGTVGEDRAEILTGKADWSSLESADKKESNEISGLREHTDYSFPCKDNFC